MELAWLGLYMFSCDKPCHARFISEPGLKSIFVAKLCVVLNFCILINNELTPVQKFKTP